MNEITAFVEVVLNKSQPSVNFEDGRKALVLAETAYKSVKSGRMEKID
jgi:myo-inositol 2-dehydrogenase/D-chiro-inositol 1-dehydrogenase